MRAEPLTRDRVADFVAYCKKHRSEVDESNLYDEQLAAFGPGGENPAYVVMSPEGAIVAAASLIIDDYQRRGRQARFRILHSELGGAEGDQSCRLLIQALVNHADGLDRFIIFVPMGNAKMMTLIEGLGFSTERYSFVLARDVAELPEYAFPAGYRLRAFVPGRDEETWCEVRNAGFAGLKGSETPLTPENLSRHMMGDGYIEGGLMMLFHGERAVGVVGGLRDDSETPPALEIGPLAVIPEYQGKGLGRNLLRASMHFARENSLSRVALCVNAENERAKTLYVHEGFEEVESVVCYRYDLARRD